MRKLVIVGALACLAVFLAVGGAGASTPGADVRLTNDCHPDGGCGAGYVSAYTLATGNAYTDATLDECTISHGRQNEPAVAVDPRNTSLLLGSSNDYCAVYNKGIPAGAVGPIWLGYYRSLDGGSSWTSSLVPGYPDDTSPYASLSQTRTATAGDPVIAWDNHGRAFFGSETSGDPAGTAKTFGDVFVARYRNPGGPDAADTTKDGLEYYGSTVVAHGSSAPNLLGVFHDKTSIEADRTGSSCDGNVYFSWSRFNGSGANEIYFVRSTDHGVTFSQPMRLESSLKSLQFPDISVTHNGHVYVTFRTFTSVGPSSDAIYIVKSTDCGKTFSPAQQITTFIPNDAQDQASPGPVPTQAVSDDPNFLEGTDAHSDRSRDCGDFQDACTSGYTFFRRDTQVRSTADQLDASHEWIYMVYDATKPGTEVSTGTTYGTDGRGVGGQAGTFFIRYNGANGTHTAPVVIDDQATGHQVFPDISADGGVLHAIWWDSRNDSCYSVTRPIGNCADRTTVPSLDVYGATSTDAGASWTGKTRITDVSTNPNYEQFDNRAVPFAGDYLWVTSLGSFAYTVWTDWRNTVQGTDPREATEDADATTSDVHQCRTLHTVQTKKGPVSFWSGDLCPHDGGIDQNIYGDLAP
ncbi:MAG: exo-alpha-sialidase [Actinobacteria bacterium]|nr:MAG: exo-alpha-sialidase [Actinomycetota bacterium]